MHPKDSIFYFRDTCSSGYMSECMVALFTIARKLNHPRCSSTDKTDDEIVVHIYNRILLSYKKNEILRKEGRNGKY